MVDEPSSSSRRSIFRRHKVLTAVGGAAVLTLALAIGGAVAGNDAAAIAAVVEQSQETHADLQAASGALSDALDEARALAEKTRGEVADPAHHADLLAAITNAETVAAERAEQATAEMSLEDAEKAHAEARALLARLSAADAPLREAMDAATRSHEGFLADALAEAKTLHADAQAELASTIPAAEQVLADSEGRVAAEDVRVALSAALDGARTAAAAVPNEDHVSHRDAAERAAKANREVAAARDAVTASVAQKDAADKAEAERVAAEQAAAEKAAAGRAAADKAAAEARAAQEAASASSGGGSVYYENCAAARAAGAAPVYASDPGYSRKLDRDGDGVGCEN